MNQKPLLYVLIATLVIVLAGFVYLNMSTQKSTSTTPGGTKAKVTLPPEPESPRVFTSPVPNNSGTQGGTLKPKVANMQKVTITATGFVPEEVAISPGDIVTWTNNDTVPHKIKGTSKWGSLTLAPGKRFSQQFDVVATYSYTDEVNPTLTGRVVVK